VAHDRNERQIAEVIGADWVVYQDLEDLVACARKGNKSIMQFDTSCFSGNYVTGDVDQQYLDDLERNRNDTAKMERNAECETIDLHNVD
jgi:amidophosphoribosyltransferase